MPVEIPKGRDLEHKVFDIHNAESAASIALEVYHFQFHNNPLYRKYCEVIHRTPSRVRSIIDIPFLPISFFKTHPVKTTDFVEELLFKSSGTTGHHTSFHYVKDSSLYRRSFLSAFQKAFGEVEEFVILGLLPSYLSQGNSSLVYMVDELIRLSRKTDSDFFLNEWDRLHETVSRLEAAGQKSLLFGVTYALLDFAAARPLTLNHTRIIETGGMKGRGKEMTKSELYGVLGQAFGVETIYSEYGMTELLSQAYARNGLFTSPPWMQVFLREETDPFRILEPSKPITGVINLMDLANLYSCSFIATDDIGRLYPDGRFEVLGRLDNSDIRGCSQLVL